jgi:PAS domain S-box-containing protein
MDFFHPDFHETIKKRIKLLRETEIQSLPVSQEQIIRTDGKVIDVDVISATFHFHGGNDIHVILRDITERKRMEQELRDSRDLLARLADRVPGAVFQLSLRSDGKLFFPFISPGIEKIHGFSPTELYTSAEPVISRIHPEERVGVEKEISESARTLQELNAEFRILVSNQDYRWFQCSAKPERADDGGTLWSGILTDITDRKLDEQKIAEQLDELHRWQSVMLGREKRAIELKQEVNALLDELGRPPRYQYSGTKRPHGGLKRHNAPGVDDLTDILNDEDGRTG